MSVFDRVYCMLQNLSEWIRDKEEVEIVDLILRIKEKLVSDAASILIQCRMESKMLLGSSAAYNISEDRCGH